VIHKTKSFPQVITRSQIATEFLYKRAVENFILTCGKSCGKHKHSPQPYEALQVPHISELDISLQKPYNNSVEVQK
jgi:hypothetical protein